MGTILDGTTEPVYAHTHTPPHSPLGNTTGCHLCRRTGCLTSRHELYRTNSQWDVIHIFALCAPSTFTAAALTTRTWYRQHYPPTPAARYLCCHPTSGGQLRCLLSHIPANAPPLG